MLTSRREREMRGEEEGREEWGGREDQKREREGEDDRRRNVIKTIEDGYKTNQRNCIFTIIISI